MNAPTVYTNSNNATLGHKCFLTLQTIYTNWERRLAVRAPNERPYDLQSKSKSQETMFPDFYFYISYFQLN